MKFDPELEAMLRSFGGVMARWRLTDDELVALVGIGRLPLARRDLLSVGTETAIRHVVEIDGHVARLIGDSWVPDWRRRPNPARDDRRPLSFMSSGRPALAAFCRAIRREAEEELAAERCCA